MATAFGNSLACLRNHIVLDAFCGRGTALVSAQNLGRKWIGIDISPTACRIMAKRHVKDCGLIEGKDFVVRDLPWSEEKLRKIPPFEFENWAVMTEIGAFFRREHRVIVPFTVREILDEEIAAKLA